MNKNRCSTKYYSKAPCKGLFKSFGGVELCNPIARTDRAILL